MKTVQKDSLCYTHLIRKEDISCLSGWNDPSFSIGAGSFRQELGP
jgi:hypothetical protein